MIVMSYFASIGVVYHPEKMIINIVHHWSLLL